jgi:hypothetical protein
MLCSLFATSRRLVDFYETVLGFRTLIWMPGRATFFQAPGSTNDHDLGTFQIGSQADPRRPAALASVSTTSPGKWTPFPNFNAFPAC